ncbi:MAG: radical SAM protein [Candidatus Nitrohelix vancouverensis]|uniref:Radical SAM protein n=1 Tax=Candidatus Nitrohelix vancouverensis TaxID=2705534 RepID=A0A7T0C036_9BACT|nr:MAG: radical SAM protein [Candidatus Nitrohelix vancouverensis]
MSDKSNPKILMVTTPIRPVPTNFPPIGSLSVLTALHQAGYENTIFYNIDRLRPSYSEVLEFIKKEQPDILGVSAVVSTAYDYTKKLTLDVKKMFPDTTILLGGNMGASAEILLKKTGVDFVCTGEGEQMAVDFVNCWVQAKGKGDFADVKGVSYLDDESNFVVTPFSDPIEPERMYEIDWSILEDLGQMEIFVPVTTPEMLSGTAFGHDARVYEPHRYGKTILTIPVSKGCVARCTFCHRWDRAIRYIPLATLMERIDYFIEKYNTGFINVADENFGTNKRYLSEFIKEMKKRDLLWKVGGMRVHDITSKWIGDMKEAGCVEIQYGMESGSQRILDVMEKKTTVEENMRAVRLMAENNLHTTMQMVLGMPGESPETVKETAAFTSYAAELARETDPNDLSINFAQALPGTPLYEVGRRKGFIGQSFDDEEKYLLQISDRDARDGEAYINYTDYPKIMLEKWRFEIQNATVVTYIKKWGMKAYYKKLMDSTRLKYLIQQKTGKVSEDSGYFADPARAKEQNMYMDSANLLETEGQEESLAELRRHLPSFFSLIKKRAKIGHIAMFYPIIFWRVRRFMVVLFILNGFRKYPLNVSLGLTKEYLIWRFKEWFSLSETPPLAGGYTSLRKVLRNNVLPEIVTDNPMMESLRKGR